MQGKLYYRSTFAAHNANCQNFKQSHFVPVDPTVTAFVDTAEIVMIVEADEGVHNALSSDPNFHAMSLLIGSTPLCAACCSALSGRGIVSGDSMWVAGNKLSAILPTLRPSRF